jgi:predicted CoA-binding protein
MSTTDLLEDPATTIAVVGATDDPEKTGHRIYRDLKSKGFTVYPVNPSRPTVDGDPAYPSLAALPRRPGIVDIVVPPAVTLQVLQEAHRLGLGNVWVQPGAADDAVLDYLSADGFDAVTGACIMVHSRPVAEPSP